MKYLLLLSVLTTFLITSCNNENKTPGKTGTDEPAIEKNYAGAGKLHLELAVDGAPITTDSAKYTINEMGGMELEAWGQRLTEGPYAYTYTLTLRFGAFDGAGDYSLKKELGSTFWQYKSYYVDAGHFGSLTIETWNENTKNGNLKWMLMMDMGRERV
ncbi:MAG: hypothetical protein WDN26_01605 [Chitinophagaceae bacterium]